MFSWLFSTFCQNECTYMFSWLFSTCYQNENVYIFVENDYVYMFSWLFSTFYQNVNVFILAWPFSAFCHMLWSKFWGQDVENDHVYMFSWLFSTFYQMTMSIYFHDCSQICGSTCLLCGYLGLFWIQAHRRGSVTRVIQSHDLRVYRSLLQIHRFLLNIFT